MSSKVSYISAPGDTRSQTADTLRGMISERAADRRATRNDARDERRFQLNMARQNRQDALANARFNLANKRYDNERAEAKAERLATVQMQADAMLPTDLDFTKSEMVEDKDNITGFEYEMTDRQAKTAPDVFSYKKEDVTANDNKIATDITKIQDQTGVSDIEKTIAIRNYMKNNGMQDLLDDEDNLLTKAAKKVGRVLARPAEYGDLAGDTLSKIYSSNEQDEQNFLNRQKDSKQLDDFYKIDNPIEDLKAKVLAINLKKATNKENKTTQTETQAVYNEWLKNFKKDTYGKKSVKKPVTEAEGNKRVNKWIKDEEKKINPNLSPLQKARKRLAIRTRANADLKILKERLITRGKTQAEVSKENRKFDREVLLENFKHDKKMIQIITKEMEGRKLSPAEQAYKKSQTAVNTAKAAGKIK